LLIVFSIIKLENLEKDDVKEIEMNHPLHGISEGAAGLAELED